MHNLSSFMQNNKTLREVLSTLEEGGHTAHLVGGSVRDALLHRASQDFDIATSAQPQQVSDLFTSKGFAVHETGIEHGTLTVVTDKIPFEITTWRRDISTDGRRATIAFADNLEDDAMRRDFTINALFADRSGRILDPTGQGLNDIKNRRVRFIGNAETRIREDHLRILRFFRFNALLGTSIDRDSVDFEECARAAPSVVTLPAERIGTEVIKLLSQPAPAEAMAAMVASGTTRHFLPDLSRNDEKVGATLSAVLRRTLRERSARTIDGKQVPPEIALVRSKRHIEDPPRTAPGGDYALVARFRRNRLTGVVFVDVDVDARNECGAPAWLRKRGELIVGGVGGSTSRAFHCSDGSVSDFCERRGLSPSSVLAVVGSEAGAAQARQAGCFVCALLPGEPVTESNDEGGYLNGHRPLRVGI